MLRQRTSTRVLVSECEAAGYCRMEGDIGFVGLGSIGYQMALSVRRQMNPQSKLYVMDVNAAAVTRFVSEASKMGQVIACESPRDVTNQIQTLYSSVPASSHVQTVYLDEDTGVIAAGKNVKRLYLELSTIDAPTTRSVGEAIMKAGHGTYVDCPVSGTLALATAGKLAILAGTSETSENWPRVRAAASLIGTPDKMFLCGSLGGGVSAKIVNNFLFGNTLIAVAEAMNIGIRSGLDKKVLYNLIHKSSGQSFAGDSRNPVPGASEVSPANNEYERTFSMQMMLKDMSLGVNAADTAGVKLRLGQYATEIYEQACENSFCQTHDVTSVYRFLGGLE